MCPIESKASTTPTFVTIEEEHRRQWQPSLQIATQKINAMVGRHTRRPPYQHMETTHKILFDALTTLSAITHKMYTDIRESNQEYAPLCFKSSGYSLDVKDIHARAVADLITLHRLKMKIDRAYPPIVLGDAELSEADSITFNSLTVFNEYHKFISFIARCIYTAYKLETTTFTYSQSYSLPATRDLSREIQDKPAPPPIQLHSVTSPCRSLFDEEFEQHASTIRTRSSDEIARSPARRPISHDSYFDAERRRQVGSTIIRLGAPALMAGAAAASVNPPPTGLARMRKC